jgi:putative multiple sugar transport system substrate-binding protein
MKRFLAVVFSVMFIVSVVSCSSNGSTSKGKTEKKTVKNEQKQSSPSKTIGILMPTKSSQRWIDEGNTMVKIFKENGFKTDITYAEDVPDNQVTEMKRMIEEGVSCLIVAAVDGLVLTDVLKSAKEKKIPVISYDRLIKGSENVDYYATFDNFKVGVLQASNIVDMLKLKDGSGPFNIELFFGSTDDNNAFMFFGGAMSILQPYIDSKKLVVKSGQMEANKCATARWDGAIAKTRLDGIIQKFYAKDKIDAILSPYDGISRGVIDSLKGAGYGTAAKPLPVITGQDAEPDSIKLIIAKAQTSTVFKDTRILAERTSKMVFSLLKGEKPEINDTKTYNNGKKIVPSYLEQPVLVDINNYKEKLIDSKYYTEDQLK